MDLLRAKSNDRPVAGAVWPDVNRGDGVWRSGGREVVAARFLTWSATQGSSFPKTTVRSGRKRFDRFCGDAAMRADLAHRGLDRARTEFAWPIVARRHLDFFARGPAQ